MTILQSNFKISLQCRLTVGRDLLHVSCGTETFIFGQLETKMRNDRTGLIAGYLDE